MPKRTFICTLLAAALVAACDRPSSPEPPKTRSAPAPAAEPAKAVASTPSIPAHMREHFTKIHEMKLALIRAKLDDYGKSAVWMA